MEELKYRVLVNMQHLLDRSYMDLVNLIETKNIENEPVLVEERTLTAYESLKAFLLENGIHIGIDSAYRSIEDQANIKRQFIEKYGEEYAKTIVAEPGTSEHHTGLAIDIVPFLNGKWVSENADMLKEENVFAEIHGKLSEFGFILRYPEFRENITGYPYEPWHIRYVGKRMAEEIASLNLTLEEYLLGK